MSYNCLSLFLPKLPSLCYMREYHEKMNNVDGEKLGNPDKIAGAFLQLLNSSNPATNLFLGSMHLTRQKLELNN